MLLVYNDCPAVCLLCTSSYESVGQPSRMSSIIAGIPLFMSRIIAVMSSIYCNYFGARHLICDDYTAIFTTLHNGF